MSKPRKANPRPTLEYETLHRKAGRVCVGVDEVGRGCLAGPVVTAAVVLPEFMYTKTPACAEQPNDAWWLDLNDSKLVAAPLRERLAQQVLDSAQVQVAWCYPNEIDLWNILHATMIAMRQALGPFSGLAQTVLVDGHLDPFNPMFRCRQGLADRLGFTHVETLVKGDQRSLSIAAASIVAKVYRDKWMSELDQIFPGYAFVEHKGYSTPKHYAAIAKLGACAIHRLSFAPFKTSTALPA